MQKFISQKQLYSNFKSVSDEVQAGTTFIVVKYSKPAFKISPLDGNTAVQKKKYTMKDLDKFVFKSKKKSSLIEDFSDLQFSDDKNLSQNIDNILYN